jgi:hypothetical protein
MDLKSFEAKVKRKKNIVYADVIKTSNYNTEARSISTYRYNPDRKTFTCIDSDRYGTWMTVPGFERYHDEIKDLRKKGYIVFHGRPSLEKVSKMKKERK